MAYALHRATLALHTPLGTPLAGDTLFGQLCWALREASGEAELTHQLAGYTQGQPWLVVSDGFPAGYLPKPTLPQHFEPQRDPGERKAAKKRRWIPASRTGETLATLLATAVGDAAAYGQSPLFAVQAHNTLNRLTGTTGENEFAPYSQPQTCHAAGQRIDIYLVLDADRVTADQAGQLLSAIGASGFGRDASTGLGKFNVERLVAASFASSGSANACWTLAPCAPQGQGFDGEQSYWRVLTRFGRHRRRSGADRRICRAPVCWTGPGRCRETLQGRSRHRTARLCAGAADQSGAATMSNNTRTLSISTLSPIHIGCDEVYEPSNFVIHEGLLHTLDPGDLAESLNAAERKQLATLADQREPIGAIQRFFRDRAEHFAGLSRHQVAVAADIVSEYERNAGRPTQRSEAGEATYNVFPIARTAYRPFDCTPYLPGSSLKGSIRTAWLNHLNRGAELTSNERSEKRNAARRLQERLLGYAAGKFENDPFRHLGLADAHPEDDTTPPPTRVLYAISKKKRLPRDGERSPQELKTFLETIPDALPAAFLGELRLSGKIGWNELCDSCNRFYQPQLEAELAHAVLGTLLDADWKKLVKSLLDNELADLIKARQGFLLRVGRNSGAESVTLDGLRDIKILGKQGEQPTYRSATTQKRFSSLSKAGAGNLLPFGWLWVNACDDAHRHLSDGLYRKLAARSSALREAHQAQLLRLEDQQEARAAASAEAARQLQAIAAAEQARIEAEAARQAALASMSPNTRHIEEFKLACAKRFAQLPQGKPIDALNTKLHNDARKLCEHAREDSAWSADEKCALADAITEWLPKVVKGFDKDQLKKLKLSALRGLA